MQPPGPAGITDFNLPFLAPSTSATTSSSHQLPASATMADDSAQAKGRAPRVTRACAVCRRRKVRCDGQGPADEGDGEAERPCSLCVQQGHTCTYEQRVQKRPVAKGYVESLEQRLAAMEALLGSLAGKPAPNQAVAYASDATAGRGRSDSPGGVESTGGRNGLGAVSRSRAPSPPPTDLDQIGQIAARLDDLAIETNRYVGRGSGLHLVESVHNHLELGSIMQRENPSLVDKLLQQQHCRLRTDAPLPPPDLAHQLIEAAFNHLAQWPFVVRAHFDECLASGMTETDTSFRSLYFAICTLGARFVDDPRLDIDPSQVPTDFDAYSLEGTAELPLARGYHYFWASCETATPPLLSATIYDLQSACIQILWLFGSSGHLTSWTAIGFAVRRAIDVGCHREERSRWSSSPLQNQMRKRAFLALLSLDRFVSSFLGRPLAIADADVDVQAPMEITDEELLEWERQARAAKVKGLPMPPPPSLAAADPSVALPPTKFNRWKVGTVLHEIMGSALLQLYGLRREKAPEKVVQIVCELDSRLNAWLELVPSPLSWNPSQMGDPELLASSWLMTAYYSCQILVHREFISPSRSRALGFPSLSICTNAARSSARVLDTLRQRGLLQQAFAWCPMIAVTSGLMLCLGVFATPKGPPGSPPATLTPSALADVKRCLQALDFLSTRSFMALKCYEGLSRLASLVVPPGALGGLDGTPASSASPTTTRNPLNISLKRGFGTASEDASPASDRPSPPDTTGDADGAPHKTRRLGVLPFSTSDLSSSTFLNRPTFVPANNAASASGVPAPSSFPSHPPPPFPSSNFDLNSLSGFETNSPFASTASQPFPPAPVPAFDPSQYLNPSLPQQTSAFPTTGFPPAPSGLSADSGLFGSTNFWTLPFDNAVPQAVGQGFADLMANFGMPEGAGVVPGEPFNFGMDGGVGGGGDATGGGGFGTSGGEAFDFSSGTNGGGYDASLFGGLSPFQTSHAP